MLEKLPGAQYLLKGTQLLAYEQRVVHGSLYINIKNDRFARFPKSFNFTFQCIEKQPQKACVLVVGVRANLEFGEVSGILMGQLRGDVSQVFSIWLICLNPLEELPPVAAIPP